MQTLRFPGFPTAHSSFRTHRASIDHPKFPLNLTLSKPATSPIWTALPTPPMSGTSPPHTPRDITQIAGRRRKRSDTPPGTTSSVATIPSLVEQSPFSYGLSPVGERREDSNMSIATQPLPYLPPLTYGIGPGLSLSQYSPPEFPTAPQSQVSPRATRKTKAHVASACINCKKKHLRCDNSRPCKRCVSGGKEDTCKDVEHKKRGRPPLKPEDPTSIGRPRELGPAVPAPYLAHGGAPLGHGPRVAGGSAYPPILPSAQPPSYMTPYARPTSRSTVYGGLQTPYAPPTIGQSSYTASAGGFSYSRPPPGPPSMTVQSPSPYVSAGQTLPHESRQMSGFGPSYHYQNAQPEMSPHYAPGISHNVYSREQSQPAMQLESPQSSYGGSNLQLPPIRPTSHVAYVEPSMTAHQSLRHPQLPQQQANLGSGPDQQPEARGRDSKRPKMDIQGILGPRHD